MAFENMRSSIALSIEWFGFVAVMALMMANPSGADAEPVSMPSYEFCGDPFSVNAFGRPVDQNAPADKEYVAGIEFNHFNRDVETLVRGKTSDSPVDDLAYILRQVPNHYRALATMASFQLKNGYLAEHQRNKIFTADCYFRRALSFKPDDPVIHSIYGIYLHRSGALNAALTEYLIAEQIGPASAELHYNLGLLYVELKQYGPAREQARKAYALGYPLTGLRARLDRLGEWRN